MLPKIKINLKVSAAISALVGMITIGTVSYHFLEGWPWVRCFYFSVATISTVGYGDMYPSNDASRIFTALYILSGVGIALTSLGVIGSEYIEGREKKLLEKEKQLLEARDSEQPHNPS